MLEEPDTPLLEEELGVAPEPVRVRSLPVRVGVEEPLVSYDGVVGVGEVELEEEEDWA